MAFGNGRAQSTKFMLGIILAVLCAQPNCCYCALLVYGTAQHSTGFGTKRPPLLLAGHSLGGPVALLCMLRYYKAKLQ